MCGQMRGVRVLDGRLPPWSIAMTVRPGQGASAASVDVLTRQSLETKLSRHLSDRSRLQVARGDFQLVALCLSCTHNAVLDHSE
jgi:hypothetical protein